ncbi:hypothetical protein SAMN05414139_01749 [Burkholderia sp. D7]|nr:hypothetical protein SAMN05414139_01749 [Burkholderia sp. D7]
MRLLWFRAALSARVALRQVFKQLQVRDRVRDAHAKTRAIAHRRERRQFLARGVRKRHRAFTGPGADYLEVIGDQEHQFVDRRLVPAASVCL